MTSARERRIVETFGFEKRLAHFSHILAAESQRLGRRLNILDVGCGTGQELTDPLAREGHVVVGIDIHLPSLRLGQVATYVCCETGALRSGRFDAVVCSEVLEHVDEPLTLLLEVHRLLLPEGLCLVTVPNGYGPYEAADRASRLAGRLLRHVGRGSTGAIGEAARRPVTDSLNYSNSHVNFFTSGSIRRLFDQAGFDEIRFRGRTVLCGPVLSDLVATSRRLISLNEQTADALPAWVLSGWMFTLRARA